MIERIHIDYKKIGQRVYQQRRAMGSRTGYSAHNEAVGEASEKAPPPPPH